VVDGRVDAWAILGRVPAWLQWEHVAWFVLVWVLLTAGSFALVLRIVLALPEEYFEAGPPPRQSWTAARVARNAAGVVVIALGMVLSVPGVPGQGVLTILVGLLLVDFPGRRALEVALVRRAGVLPALNRLRARFGRRPLRPPPVHGHGPK
jgi:hypothetical protein